MSFSYWWFSCFLNNTDYHELIPLASEAKRKANLRIWSSAELAYWQNHLKQSNISNELHKKNYNKFISAFSVDGYTEFAKEIIDKNMLSEENCFRFIITNRCPPVAILWQAIGYEKALLLPGNMGNIFLSSDELEDSLSKTNQAFAGLNMDVAIERGVRFAGHSNSSIDILDVLTHLPEGLSQALKLRKGFLALARPQI